ncbi:MAG: hypothetical protein CL609_03470 [Anaerolineaceae bacterium]|nr:hypothetical protein [Anaerolineaceae bacterium]
MLSNSISGKGGKTAHAFTRSFALSDLAEINHNLFNTSCSQDSSMENTPDKDFLSVKLKTKYIL